MIYLGIAFTAFAVLLAVSEYGKYMNKRLSECEGFLLFIKHIRCEMACYMKPPCELVSGFECEALSHIGFIPFLAEGAGLCEAFEKCEGRLSLGEGEKEIVKALFSELGSGYLEESIKKTDSAIERLEGPYQKLKEECPKKKRLTAALSACGILGLIILAI